MGNAISEDRILSLRRAGCSWGRDRFCYRLGDLPRVRPIRRLLSVNKPIDARLLSPLHGCFDSMEVSPQRRLQVATLHKPFDELRPSNYESADFGHGRAVPVSFFDQHKRRPAEVIMDGLCILP